MGKTYDTDGIDTRNVLAMTVQVALVVKSLANLISCRSWLQARLAIQETQERLDKLVEMVEKGSAD
jgi:hypothetical protein